METPITEFRGDHRFLSNFVPAVVVLDGHEHPTVEHAYQAAKTFDPEWRARIAAAPTPKHAKRIGRKAPLRDDWDAVRDLIMADLVVQKFTHPELAQQLVATGTRPLIEGNRWHDTHFGVCSGCHAGCDGVGDNRLGRLLEHIRARLAVTAPS